MSNEIERVLGPKGQELGCDECFELLDQYVELELREGESKADASVPGMHAHFEGCPACREEHESLRALVASEDAD